MNLFCNPSHFYRAPAVGVQNGKSSNIRLFLKKKRFAPIRRIAEMTGVYDFHIVVILLEQRSHVIGSDGNNADVFILKPVFKAIGIDDEYFH